MLKSAFSGRLFEKVIQVWAGARRVKSFGWAGWEVRSQLSIVTNTDTVKTDCNLTAGRFQQPAAKCAFEVCSLSSHSEWTGLHICKSVNNRKLLRGMANARIICEAFLALCQRHMV